MSSGTIRKFLLGFPGFERLCLWLTRRHVRVFMYHRFTDDPDREPGHTPVGTFEQHLDHLLGRCDVVDPDRQHAFESGLSGARRPLAVVTADDGYADFYRHAYPALKARGLPAVLFVTTGFVTGDIWMWWDKVSYLLDRSTREEVEVVLAGQSLRGPLQSARDRRVFWSKLVPALRFVPDDLKEQVIIELAEQLQIEVPATAPAEYAASGWEEIGVMATGGIVMGAHTRTHPILSRVDAGRALEEVAGSRDELARHLERDIDWFAYTQGGPADYNDETLAAVRATGFSGAYLAYCDPALGNSPPLKPRYFVGGAFDDFRWSVCGADFLGLKIKGWLGRSTTVSEDYWTGSDLAAAMVRHARAVTEP